MHGTLSLLSETAIKPTPEVGSETSLTLTSESDSDDWFYEAAQTLLGKDAGLHLHYITGYPQSTCYAYVANNPEKRRKPPGPFLRTLFHKPQGRPFLFAFMHGCDWWTDVQCAVRIKSAIDATE